MVLAYEAEPILSRAVIKGRTVTNSHLQSHYDLVAWCREQGTTRYDKYYLVWSRYSHGTNCITARLE